jgi:hypothetical protein
MARASHKDDFTVTVEGVGDFRFGRRQQKDQYKIRGLYAKLSGDNWKEDGTVGDLEAWWHATLEVMIVQYPDGFSLEKLDPLVDPENDDRLGRIYLALRQRETSFRPQPTTGSTGAGEGTGQ